MLLQLVAVAVGPDFLKKFGYVMITSHSELALIQISTRLDGLGGVQHAKHIPEHSHRILQWAVGRLILKL